jgi:hypothetical protein
MKLTLKQVTYLLDNSIIKMEDFNTIYYRQQPYPHHLMLLQKAGLLTEAEIENYEADIVWNIDTLLSESEKDKAMMGKYDFKFQNYLREQLAAYKLDGSYYLVITWNDIEFDIPELVKVLYIKRMKRFGYNFIEKKLAESGKEFYRFKIGPLEPNQTYTF